MSARAHAAAIAIGLAAIGITTLTPQKGQACSPGSPWEAESISSDAPSCFETRNGGGGDVAVEFDNTCDTAVTVEPVDCGENTCRAEPMEVSPGEQEFFLSSDLGLDYDEVEDGDTTDFTVAWMRGEMDEGTIDFTVRFDGDVAGACSGLGCGGCSAPETPDPPPYGNLVAFLMLLGIGRVLGSNRR